MRKLTLRRAQLWIKASLKAGLLLTAFVLTSCKGFNAFTSNEEHFCLESLYEPEELVFTSAAQLRPGPQLCLPRKELPSGLVDTPVLTGTLFLDSQRIIRGGIVQGSESPEILIRVLPHRLVRADELETDEESDRITFLKSFKETQ